MAFSLDKLFKATVLTVSAAVTLMTGAAEIIENAPNENMDTASVIDSLDSQLQAYEDALDDIGDIAEAAQKLRDVPTDNSNVEKRENRSSETEPYETLDTYLQNHGYSIDERTPESIVPPESKGVEKSLPDTSDPENVQDRLPVKYVYDLQHTQDKYGAHIVRTGEDATIGDIQQYKGNTIDGQHTNSIKQYIDSSAPGVTDLQKRNGQIYSPQIDNDGWPIHDGYVPDDTQIKLDKLDSKERAIVEKAVEANFDFDGNKSNYIPTEAEYRAFEQTNPDDITLEKGTVLARYSHVDSSQDTGRFYTTPDTPFDALGLPGSEEDYNLSFYEVKEPIVAQAGIVAATHESPGGGDQYTHYDISVDRLLDEQKLQEVRLVNRADSFDNTSLKVGKYDDPPIMSNEATESHQATDTESQLVTPELSSNDTSAQVDDELDQSDSKQQTDPEPKLEMHDSQNDGSVEKNDADSAGPDSMQEASEESLLDEPALSDAATVAETDGEPEQSDATQEAGDEPLPDEPDLSDADHVAKTDDEPEQSDATPEAGDEPLLDESDPLDADTVAETDDEPEQSDTTPEASDEPPPDEPDLSDAATVAETDGEPEQSDATQEAGDEPPRDEPDLSDADLVAKTDREPEQSDATPEAGDEPLLDESDPLDADTVAGTDDEPEQSDASPEAGDEPLLDESDPLDADTVAENNDEPEQSDTSPEAGDEPPLDEPDLSDADPVAENNDEPEQSDTTPEADDEPSRDEPDPSDADSAVESDVEPEQPDATQVAGTEPLLDESDPADTDPAVETNGEPDRPDTTQEADVEPSLDGTDLADNKTDDEINQQDSHDEVSIENVHSDSAVVNPTDADDVSIEEAHSDNSYSQTEIENAGTLTIEDVPNASENSHSPEEDSNKIQGIEDVDSVQGMQSISGIADGNGQSIEDVVSRKDDSDEIPSLSHEEQEQINAELGNIAIDSEYFANPDRPEFSTSEEQAFNQELGNIDIDSGGSDASSHSDIS